jgi:hypothetical protein
MRSAGLGRIYSLLFETGKINSGDLSDKACKAVTDKPQIETQRNLCPQHQPQSTTITINEKELYLQGIGLNYRVFAELMLLFLKYSHYRFRIAHLDFTVRAS